MPDLKEKLTSCLQNISKYCNDSVEGYKAAAESIKEEHPAVALQWQENAEARQTFVTALDNRLLSIGEDEVDSNSFKGTIHRGFLKLKGIFSSDDFDAELQECIRGEEELQSTIQEALTEVTLDGATRKLLEQLVSDVNINLMNLKALSKQ